MGMSLHVGTSAGCVWASSNHGGLRAVRLLTWPLRAEEQVSQTAASLPPYSINFPVTKVTPESGGGDMDPPTSR